MLKNVFRAWAPVPQGHKSLWGQSALASVHSEGGLLVPLKAVPDIQPALEVGAAPVVVMVFGLSVGLSDGQR